MTTPKPPSLPVQAHLKRLWLHGFLAGFGVVLVSLLLIFFIWGRPDASREGDEAAPPALKQTVPAPAPPASPHLEAQLAEVLAELGEANQNKDLRRLMSLYSPAFPELSRKQEAISRSWKTFDFLTLRFKLGEVSSLGPDSASARVTWEIRARNRLTQALKDTHQTYLVGFARESGHWRIRSLERLEKSTDSDEIS